MAAADLAFLRTSADGDFIYELAYSKTNQSGQDRPENYKPIVGEAAEALRDWLDAAGIRSGRIFRRLGRGGHVGEALSPDAVGSIVQARCAKAGLSGHFTAHSLRSGFVTAASEHGASLAETMALTGHRSAQTVLGYTRAAAVKQRCFVRDLLAGESARGGQ